MKLYFYFDFDVDETWKWVDGSLVQFENWLPGEPNGDSSTEACVEMYHFFLGSGETSGAPKINFTSAKCRKVSTVINEINWNFLKHSEK